LFHSSPDQILPETQATQEFIPHIDAALFLIGTAPPMSVGMNCNLWRLSLREVHDLEFILNQADRADATDRCAAVDFSRRVLENPPETNGIQDS